MYGLHRIKAGFYEHPSGTLIIRTGGWEGPRGARDLQRWEHATRGPNGLEVGAGFDLFPTLRAAAAALDAQPRS